MWRGLGIAVSCRPNDRGAPLRCRRRRRSLRVEVGYRSSQLLRELLHAAEIIRALSAEPRRTVRQRVPRPAIVRLDAVADRLMHAPITAAVERRHLAALTRAVVLRDVDSRDLARQVTPPPRRDDLGFAQPASGLLSFTLLSGQLVEPLYKRQGLTRAQPVHLGVDRAELLANALDVSIDLHRPLSFTIAATSCSI